MHFVPAQSEARTLNAEQIKRFNEDGYVAPLTLFDSAEAQVQRRYLDGLLTHLQRNGGDAYDINAYHTHCQGIYDIVTHPRLLDYVEDLIGPNIVCWGSHYFCKLPGDVREVPYHQDAPYWPFRPNHGVTAWIAIDDVHEAAGPMCFLPGSHRQGRLEWQRRTDNVVLQLEVKDRTALAPPQPLLLKAGQVSLHTDLLVHGSAANFSKHRRCGLTIRYLPAEVWVKDGADPHWTSSAVLCRGADISARWPNNPRPNQNFFGLKMLNSAPA
ncbi:MAG: phytanoyl-CoA dioxygenase family protein [Pseudomonadota bacterium]